MEENMLATLRTLVNLFLVMSIVYGLGLATVGVGLAFVSNRARRLVEAAVERLTRRMETVVERLTQTIGELAKDLVRLSERQKFLDRRGHPDSDLHTGGH